MMSWIQSKVASITGRNAKPSGFQWRNTAADVTEGVVASELTAIVTGATSGLGTETARVLALRGAHVYLASRTVESAAKTKDFILKEIPYAKLDILAPLDLSSQASVRKGAERFLALGQPLNLLINNAGVMATPYGLTEDGIETQFGTNHIGHFLLTDLLLGKLKETATESGTESRIVILSSSLLTYKTKEDLTLKKINEEKGYNRFNAYGLSKIANVYHAQELTRRLKEEGATNVTANSLHPGMIRTNLARHSKWLVGTVHALSFFLWKSVPQGAATICYVALHPSMKGVSGKYFQDSEEFDPKKKNPLGEDEAAAKQLWELSVQLTSK